MDSNTWWMSIGENIKKEFSRPVMLWAMIGLAGLSGVMLAVGLWGTQVPAFETLVPYTSSQVVKVTRHSRSSTTGDVHSLYFIVGSNEVLNYIDHKPKFEVLESEVERGLEGLEFLVDPETRYNRMDQIILHPIFEVRRNGVAIVDYATTAEYGKYNQFLFKLSGLIGLTCSLAGFLWSLSLRARQARRRSQD
jgi:hypothetical protein